MQFRLLIPHEFCVRRSPEFDSCAEHEPRHWEDPSQTQRSSRPSQFHPFRFAKRLPIDLLANFCFVHSPTGSALCPGGNRHRLEAAAQLAPTLLTNGASLALWLCGMTIRPSHMLGDVVLTCLSGSTTACLLDTELLYLACPFPAFFFFV